MAIFPRMSESIYITARFIIQSTHDGEDLAPHHLKLVEMAVNGHLNEDGEVAFYKLAASVREGYQKPWFHGIEHLTYDHEGFVYWKGHKVEHYTPRWAHSEEAAREAHLLALKCQYLEAKGEDVGGALGVPDQVVRQSMHETNKSEGLGLV